MADIELDNRGLQPPEPMVRILAALAELDRDGQLVALMDREPLLLYPELKRRGFTWDFTEDGGHHRLTITRAGQA